MELLTQTGDTGCDDLIARSRAAVRRGCEAIAATERLQARLSMPPALEGRPFPAAFGALKYRCPSSGRFAETGIYADTTTLAAVRAVPIQPRCPHCGEHHTLQVKDTFLDPYAMSGPRRPTLAVVEA